MKLLIIEDEKDLAASIVSYIEKEGHVFDVAHNFDKADEYLHMNEYDCVLVDIMLPDGSGLDVIRNLRRMQRKCGILVISAKDSLDDKIRGLDLGADDYLTKPFHLAELNARIKSIIRRRTFEGSNEVEVNEIKIELDKREVEIKGYPVELTRREYDILLFFLSNKERVLTKEAITEHVWGDDSSAFDNLDFVYTHIKNLRRKLGEAGAADYIHSVYGVGYKFTLR